MDYYGAPTPVNQLAAVSVSEARVLTIQPWDVSSCKAITRAIETSDLGINPQTDGKIIRLSFPPLSEERRRDLVKEINKMAEEAKVAMRAIRRDAMDKLKEEKEFHAYGRRPEAGRKEDTGSYRQILQSSGPDL